MEVIVLDWDGVVNKQKRQDNGCYGTCPDNVENLNVILRERPDAKIVISSTRRNFVHQGWMTLKGFEAMLRTHGIDCAGRVVGVTESDRETWDRHTGNIAAQPTEAQLSALCFQYRSGQVQRWFADNAKGCVTSYVVLDDCPNVMPRQVTTVAHKGLTYNDALQAIALLENRLPEPVRVRARKARATRTKASPKIVHGWWHETPTR